MEVVSLDIEGAYILKFSRIEDHRGHFARIFCNSEFSKLGLNVNILQSSISFNKKKGTIRGMHYQSFPHEEDKFVKCLQGKVLDVIVDIRPKSKTFLKWVSIELDEKDDKILYIPKGCAHGFQTLKDCSSLLYFMTQNYFQDSAKGFLWSDKKIGIKWPLKNVIISAKDAALCPFE
jgi:dTDP-4-dehydrorhamnose 3,5-epimerase